MKINQNNLDECKKKQCISLKSLKDNLPRVFGIQNDFFAEMIFSYLSNHAPKDHKINFLQFYKAFMVFWPKPESSLPQETKESKQWRETQERMAQEIEYKQFMFDFMRLQGHKSLGILDLVKLSMHFQPNCPFGREVKTLLDKYYDFNIKPKFVFH